MDRLRRVVTGSAKRFQENDVPGLGAELAYRFLFAIFPFGLFAAALAAFVAGFLGIDNPTDRLIGALGDNLPPDAAASVRPELERVLGEARPGLLSIGAIGALWAATGGTLALMKGMNRAYDVEESRSFITRYLVAIGLTLLATVGIIASFVTIVGSALITQELSEQLGLGAQAWQLLNILRWPAVFLALVLAVAILYRNAPNARAPWRWILVGAVVFTLGWLVATALLAWYTTTLGNYGATYGSLGGVIVLMLWFYVTGMLLVLGGEVVAIATEVYEPGALQERRDQLAPVTDGVKERATEAVDGLRDTVEREHHDDGRDRTPAPRRAPARGPVVQTVSRDGPDRGAGSATD